MFLTRLSRFGAGIARQLQTVKRLPLSDVGSIQRARSRLSQSQFMLHPETEVSWNMIFQKYHQFSTTASESADGREETETIASDIIINSLSRFKKIEFHERISVTFVDKDGEEHQIKVPVGMSILEAAHENDIELEGACEGSLACSTCHVIVLDTEYFNKLEDPTDEENDMLDLAFGLTETSRLGCQIIAKPELDGICLALPQATRNFAVDGYVAKPH